MVGSELGFQKDVATYTEEKLLAIQSREVESGAGNYAARTCATSAAGVP